MAFQFLEFRSLLANRAQLRFEKVSNVRARFHVRALEDEKLSNFIQRETQLLGTSDEVNVLEVL